MAVEYRQKQLPRAGSGRRTGVFHAVVMTVAGAGLLDDDFARLDDASDAMAAARRARAAFAAPVLFSDAPNAAIAAALSAGSRSRPLRRRSRYASQLARITRRRPCSVTTVSTSPL